MIDMINYKEAICTILNNRLYETCIICKNTSNKPYIIANDSSSYNEEYAKANNIQSVYAGHTGGSLLLFPEDLGFTWISTEKKLPMIIQDLLDYLKAYNTAIKLEGNDIMLDNNKLFGTMSSGDGPYYEGMFFSFNSDIDTIKKICKKPMKKEPYGLSNLGITSEEIEKLIVNLCNKYELKIYGGEK